VGRTTQKRKLIAGESPSTIHYKGVTLNPAWRLHRKQRTVFPRQRATSHDIKQRHLTAFPYPGNALGKVDREQLHRQAIPPQRCWPETTIGSAKWNWLL